MNNAYYIYLLTNAHHTTLYTGVTSNLERRIYEHKNKLADGFTKKYNLDKLVYFEQTESINSAIAREKEIKGWLRQRKDDLINNLNPSWDDLSLQLFGDSSPPAQNDKEKKETRNSEERRGKGSSPFVTKNFQRMIEDFTCAHCGAEVTGNGYTNHCPHCLYSQHVDINPGDRAETCGGLMPPVALVQKKGEWVITHRCVACGFTRPCKTRPEDMKAVVTLARQLADPR